MKPLKKKYYPLAIIGILFLVIYLIGTRVPEETIRLFVKNAGASGPIVLIILFWSTNIVAPLSAAPFLFAGYYLFGKTVIIYSLIAAVFASVSNFWIAKIWGRRVVEKLTGPNGLKKVDNLAENYGPKTLFILRLFLWQYHDVISYTFGLTKIGFTQYLIISIAGMIPGSLLWYYLSSKTKSALIFTLLTFIIACTFLTVYICWSKIFKKKDN